MWLDTCDEPEPFRKARTVPTDDGRAGGNDFRDGGCRIDSLSHSLDSRADRDDRQRKIRLEDRLERQPVMLCWGASPNFVLYVQPRPTGLLKEQKNCSLHRSCEKERLDSEGRQNVT